MQFFSGQDTFTILSLDYLQSYYMCLFLVGVACVCSSTARSGSVGKYDRRPIAKGKEKDAGTA
jgi:hypothetical protein